MMIQQTNERGNKGDHGAILSQHSVRKKQMREARGEMNEGGGILG